MRVARFGIIVVAFAVGWSTLIVWRLLSSQPVPIARSAPPVPDLARVKSDLCRLAHIERVHFTTTGRYGDQRELHSDGNLGMPTSPWPYLYYVSVPRPDRFLINAIPFHAERTRLTIFSVDSNLNLCSMSPNMPNAVWKLDAPLQEWGDPVPDYDCEPCPAGP